MESHAYNFVNKAFDAEDSSTNDRFSKGLPGNIHEKFRTLEEASRGVHKAPTNNSRTDKRIENTEGTEPCLQNSQDKSTQISTLTTKSLKPSMHCSSTSDADSKTNPLTTHGSTKESRWTSFSLQVDPRDITVTADNSNQNGRTTSNLKPDASVDNRPRIVTGDSPQQALTAVPENPDTHELSNSFHLSPANLSTRSVGDGATVHETDTPMAAEMEPAQYFKSSRVPRKTADFEKLKLEIVTSYIQNKLSSTSWKRESSKTLPVVVQDKIGSHPFGKVNPYDVLLGKTRETMENSDGSDIVIWFVTVSFFVLIALVIVYHAAGCSISTENGITCCNHNRTTVTWHSSGLPYARRRS